MQLLLSLSFLFVSYQGSPFEGKIYFSSEENSYILFEDDSLQLLINPYQQSTAMPFLIAGDSICFGNNSRKEDCILSESNNLKIGSTNFRLLSDKKRDEFNHYRKISNSLRKKTTEFLKDTHSDYQNLRIGNITIKLREPEKFTNLLIDVVCRYKDIDEINRGFDSHLECKVNGNDFELQILK